MTYATYYNDGDKYDGAPEWKMLSRTNVKRAQKQYTCDTCGKPIEIGKPYYREAAMEDGKFVMIRAHGLMCWAGEDEPKEPY